MTVTAGLRRLGPLLLTAALGAAGGALFAWLGLPAAWLAGSMTAVAAAALAGLPVDLPAPVRNAAFVLLGISMGTSVTPETMGQLRAWPLSLAPLASTLIGTQVYNATNEALGEANDVLLATDGRLKAVVVRVGGFPGIAERDVAVPWVVAWASYQIRLMRAGSGEMG